jgi:hypothetical protein
MISIRHHLAAVALGVVALGAGALPASAGAHPIASPAKVRAVIEKELPVVRLTVSIRTSDGAARFVGSGAATEGYEWDAFGSVYHTHADRAQYAAKREWIDAVRLEIDGHHQLGHGILENVMHPSTLGVRSMKRGLASLRRANCEFERADAALGVPDHGPVITVDGPVIHVGPVRPFANCS